MLKLSNKEEVCYDHLVNSFEALKEVVHHINEVKMQQDNLHRLHEIEQTIAGFKV